MVDAKDSLLDALSSSPPKDPRARCYAAQWIAHQTEERQEKIQEALDNPRWKTMVLFNLFKEEGYECQYNTLRAHRSGSCSCA